MVNSNKYPEDEFDFEGKNLPVGSHRKLRSRWRVIMPFIVVIILAPLCAWGAFYALEQYNSYQNSATYSKSSISKQKNKSVKNKNKETVKTDTKAEEEAKKKTEEEAARQAEEAKKRAEEEAARQAEAAIEYNAKIKSFNGTAKRGLAKRTAEIIKAQNFTNVAAGNNPGIRANKSVVYYSHDNLKATAEKIAGSLGISNIVQNSSPVGGQGLAVLIKNDFRE